MDLPMLPWEAGGMFSLVLDAERQPFPWLVTAMAPVLAVPMPAPTTTTTTATTRTPSTTKPPRRKLYASIVEGNRDDDRSFQLAKWLEIVVLAVDASATGRHLQTALNEQRSPDYVQGIVNDVLASKSSSTLAARAASVFQFLHWFRRAASFSGPPFPI